MYQDDRRNFANVSQLKEDLTEVPLLQVFKSEEGLVSLLSEREVTATLKAALTIAER